MVFDLTGKVAIVTGGASGIGLNLVKELLRNGVKGVTIADVDPQQGESVLEDIQKEFGDKAIFIKTDVTVFSEYENAFKETIYRFKNVDILLNNAGIFNDATWQKEIAINMNGAIHGILLGLENYLRKYKQGEEAVIVNSSSIAALAAWGVMPIYAGTKAALVSMTRSWGVSEHYERTKVKVVAICPGATTTPLLAGISGRNLGEPYEKRIQEESRLWATQEPEFVAKETINVIKSGQNGSIWVIEKGEPAYEYIIPERGGQKQGEDK